MSVTSAAVVPLVDALSVQDQYAEGYTVEFTGPNARVIYFRTIIEGDETYRVPVCSVVVPRGALPTAPFLH